MEYEVTVEARFIVEADSENEAGAKVHNGVTELGPTDFNTPQGALTLDSIIKVLQVEEVG